MPGRNLSQRLFALTSNAADRSRSKKRLTICSVRHTIALGGIMTIIDQAEFDILAGIGPIVNTLARLGVRYALTGSLAAVAHGVGRAVGDVDLVADLTPQQTIELASQLLPRYAVDQSVVEMALRE